MAVKPVPEGYRTITPQLSVEGALKAIDFYKKAFGAEDKGTALDDTKQKVMHCALKIGDSMVFVNDIFPEMGGTLSKSTQWVYVADCDAAFKRAIDAGGKSTFEPSDCFWGDRMGQLDDPFGQKWVIATRIKDMTDAELKAAEAEFKEQMKKK